MLLYGVYLTYNVISDLMTIFFMDKKTSIAILKETRNQLASIGTKDSTFDDIIKRLLKKWDLK